jgi:hypothetical protein
MNLRIISYRLAFAGRNEHVIANQAGASIAVHIGLSRASHKGRSWTKGACRSAVITAAKWQNGHRTSQPN